MINIYEFSNACTFNFFDFFDNTTNNPTSFVVQVNAEITDAETYDIMERIKDSDYVQRLTGATATLDGGVLVTRTANAESPE